MDQGGRLDLDGLSHEELESLSHSCVVSCLVGCLHTVEGDINRRVGAVVPGDQLCCQVAHTTDELGEFI